MAQHVRTRRYERDWQGLTPRQQAHFRTAFMRFDTDLAGGAFRAGLRIKGVEGAPGVFEMTWAPDGRATFEFGEASEAGPVVVWRRIGTHGIFRRP